MGVLGPDPSQVNQRKNRESRKVHNMMPLPIYLVDARDGYGEDNLHLAVVIGDKVREFPIKMISSYEMSGWFTEQVLERHREIVGSKSNGGRDKALLTKSEDDGNKKTKGRKVDLLPKKKGKK